MKRSIVSVLAIDGGGIRGVIPATVLHALEQRMRRPIAECFDVIAGTSTGGILALGLTKPAAKGAKQPAFSAQDLLGIYVDHGHEIFDKTIWNSVKVLIDERYSVKPLERLMKERFGDAMLSEALTEVVIPTYDLTRPGPFFFKRLYAQDRKWDVEFWKAARATSAAPTYFDPMPLPPFDGDTSRDQHALIDGGVFANNPAACAYGEALDIYTGPDGPPEVHVVSLGTGTPRAETAVPYQRACNWGLAEWASPILHVVFDGVSKTVDHQMELLCRDVQGGAPHYYRIQGELVAADPAMDDASRENIRHLQQDAARIVERNAAKLDEACEALTKIAAERDGGMSGELLKRHQPYLRYARRRSEKPLT